MRFSSFIFSCSSIASSTTLKKASNTTGSNIKLKEGNFIWNQNYEMPGHTIIRLTGENFKNDGNDNKVTILMNEQRTKVYGKTECCINSRLLVAGNSFFYCRN